MQPDEKFMKEMLKKICNSVPRFYIQNIADSCLGFMKKYFNEFSKKVEGDLVFDMKEWVWNLWFYISFFELFISGPR